MAVVLFHLTSEYDKQFPDSPEALIVFRGGGYGVHLFFVISGFVILWTIGRASRWRDFGVSRFARLYPPFWAALAMTVAWISIAGAENMGVDRPFDFTFTQLLANMTMVPQWLGHEPIDGVYWTLAIEMGFYLFVSLLFVSRLLRRDRVSIVLGAVWVLETVVISGPTFLYLFIAGMASFLLWEGVAQPRWLLWFLFLQPPLVALIHGSEVAAAADVAILVVVSLAISGKFSVLELRPLVFLGSISYSLYLVHLTAGYLTQHWLLEQGLDRNVSVVLTIGFIMALAVMLNQTVERLVSPWVRGRLSPRRVPVVESGS